jgi:hypothetical protein
MKSVVMLRIVFWFISHVVEREIVSGYVPCSCVEKSKPEDVFRHLWPFAVAVTFVAGFHYLLDNRDVV